MNSGSLQRICVAGAGAIGGALAARLAAAGHHVSVFARGATLDALRAQGLRLHDLGGTLHVRVAASDRPEFGVQDVIFLCAKAHSVGALLAGIAPLIGDHTIVVPTLNGVPWWYFHGAGGRFEGETVRAVDPDGTLATLLPARHVLGGVVYFAAKTGAPGHVTVTSPYRLVLGEIDQRGDNPNDEHGNTRISARLQAVCTLLTEAGVETLASTRIRDEIWTKLIGNLATNPLSVVTGATLQQMCGAGELRPIVMDMMQEVALVAATYGARLAVDPYAALERGAALGAFRTSMLQDYEKGQPLELAAIGEAILELADRYDIPMRMTRAILTLAAFRARHAAPASQPAAAPSTPITPTAIS